MFPTDDCSIKRLVELSKLNHGPLGQARYKYSDFMYCKDLGKISNNHMIRLRKFATPVSDNIFYATTLDDAGNFSTTGDVGRLITWFGTDDNKLEDILKYSYKAEFKEFEAKIDAKLILQVHDELIIEAHKDCVEKAKEISEEVILIEKSEPREIYEKAGCEFNINSPKQLGTILFEKLRLPYGKKTKTGYSTSAEMTLFVMFILLPAVRVPCLPDSKSST